MRWLSLLAFVAVVVVACSRKAGPSGIVPRNGSPPGLVTFRFVNATGADIKFESETGRGFRIEDKDGRGMPELHFCQGSCGTDCQCMRCGSPMPTTITIAAGAAHEARWEGDFYEDGHCEKGDCGCGEKRFAEDGPYTVTFEAGQSGKKCTAKKSFTLRAGAQTIDVPFTCAP